MKLKKIFKVIFIVIISLICLLFIGGSGALLYQKIKLEKKGKIITDRGISSLLPEIGKKRKFLADVYSVSNLDEAPFLLKGKIVRKNIITDNEFIFDSNSFEGFSAPVTEGMKKIAVAVVPQSEEFKLLNAEKNEIMADSPVPDFLSYKFSFVEAIIEDSAGMKYALSDSLWILYTNPSVRSYEATKKEERKEIQKFNEQVNIYKSNPATQMELKYCGSKTAQALFKKEIHRFDVESRMSAVLEKAFNSNEIQAEKLPKPQIEKTQLVCYKLIINHISTFLKVSYLLPKTVYGFWDNE